MGRLLDYGVNGGEGVLARADWDGIRHPLCSI